MKQLHAFFYRRHGWHFSNHCVASLLALMPIPVGFNLSARQVYGNGYQTCVQRLFLNKTDLTDPILNAKWGVETGLKSSGLQTDSHIKLAFEPSQPHMMRYDRKKDKSAYHSNNDNTHSRTNKDKESDPLPLWVRNQKLLGKIFIVWVVLVVFMLLNVFRVIHVV